MPGVPTAALAFRPPTQAVVAADFHGVKKYLRFRRTAGTNF
ncbi:hypothetical protein GLA29479_156 [Lysobacter antibioticus]|nr:hypothetical protein GLA29479_156 [Lysobacter antibioticus]